MLPFEKLKHAVLILLFLVLFFGGLYLAGSFLKPLAIGLLLAFLVLPLARILEGWGWKRIFSTLTCTLLVLVLIGGIVTLIGYQGKQFSDDYEQLREKASEKMDQVTEFVTANTGITEEKFRTSLKESSLSQVKNSAQGFMIGLLNSSTDMLLILVYLFFFLYYRAHFKRFFIKLFPDNNRENVVKVMEKAIHAALQYLKGKLILLGILAVIYIAGLLLIGVKFAIFYGILAAILTLIPYIGNIIGGGLPLLTALLYGDVTSALLVLALFTAAQFLESYLLMPYLIGRQVDLHPMMTILIVILAGSLWGIPGMIIAIPYLGIVMVIFNYIPKMEAWAYLLRQEEEENE